MASYESAAGISSVIDSALENGSISAATADAINNLLAEIGASGGNVAEAVQFMPAGENLTTATIPADAQAIVMNADSSADVTFAADSPVTALVMGGAGNSKVDFQTSDNVTVQMGGGNNDSLSTGAGDDNITFAGGDNVTIDTGAGNDVVLLTGEGSVNVAGGDGNMVIELATDAAAATIDAGDGFDRMNLVDKIINHTFEFLNGKFVMHSDNAITMENVNVVTFAGADGAIENVAVLADTAGDALTANLYQVALGRSAIDTGAGGPLGGIEFWTDRFEQEQPGSSLQHTVYSFLDCQEFKDKYDGMNDQQYVETLFSNLNAINTGEAVTNAGGTVADYVAQLASGANRFDVAWSIAASQDAVQILGAAGDKYIVVSDPGLDLTDGLA